MAETIVDLARRVRAEADDVVVRHKKLASFRLYALLAPCLELCERCGRDPVERDDLHALFMSQPHEGNRRYVERGSDIYTLVCRYVFNGTSGTNIWRYACALREASKLQIGSGQLEGWMRDNGGINALFFRRPIEMRTTCLKTLRLDRAAAMPRDHAFTLTLRWQTDNSFQVEKVAVQP